MMCITSIKSNVSIPIDNGYRYNSQNQQNKKSSKSNLGNSIKVTLTNEDKIIQALEKQKQNISDQIENIKESKMDDKSKQMFIDDLQKQISDLDSQINKQKMEKITHKEDKEKANEEKLKNDDKEKKSDGKNLDNEKFHTILTAYSGVSQLKKMHTVKVNLENELRTARVETDLNDNLSKYKISRIDKISSKLEELEVKIQKKSKEINDTIKYSTNKDEQVDKDKEIKNVANNEKEATSHKEKNETIQSSSDNKEENNMDKSVKKLMNIYK
ncbi:hypothetical protein CLPUN_29500 [Clostridium puniceum]|uniref:Uncharacterized protein n=1 Tax=Clostridium puniceum TaxID=29367 RepID=A0A1S8TDQ3_9CLOT|nr:hypothetical protein [Clostridium puniceum]OOM75913.1 hypothetical protein CLPUN_29500 [Clostridium puniceum]